MPFLSFTIKAICERRRKLPCYQCPLVFLRLYRVGFVRRSRLCILIALRRQTRIEEKEKKKPRLLFIDARMGQGRQKKEEKSLTGNGNCMCQRRGKKRGLKRASDKIRRTRRRALRRRTCSLLLQRRNYKRIRTVFLCPAEALFENSWTCCIGAAAFAVT